MTWRRWVSSLFTMLAVFPFLSSCGGGGNASSPSEIAYVLLEDSGSNGSVVEYALNPSNGTFYPGSGQTAIPTGGTAPLLFLLSPHNHYAFVLNNKTTGTSATGSVASFSVSGQGLSSTPIHNSTTGPNTVHMAVDPGGNYLVVANHGSGATTSGGGYVQVFSISSGVLISLTSSTSNSPCDNPFRVVFGPGSTGVSSDPVYVACSSPELLTSTPSPTISIYSCTVNSLIARSCSSSISISRLPTSPSALLNFMLDPGGQYLVGPGTIYSSSSSYSGFLVVCPLPGGSCTSTSISSFITIPSGNIAFTGSGTSEKVFIGNYNASSFNGNFAACTVSSNSCSGYSINRDGPIYLTANGNSLYIAATKTAISSTYSSSTNTGTGSVSSSPPSSGYLFYCTFPLSSSSSPSCPSFLSTGGWPVGIAIDPTGNFMFVPTLSGAVNVFSGVSTGSLSPLGSNPLQMPNRLIPLSVTIH